MKPFNLFESVFQNTFTTLLSGIHVGKLFWTVAFSIGNNTKELKHSFDMDDGKYVWMGCSLLGLRTHAIVVTCIVDKIRYAVH
jgi:hypothetical protein